MNETESPGVRTRTAILSLALVLTAWGILGALGPTEGYTDALYEPDYTILYAPPGSPLAQAGFQPGDSVVSVEGIPVEELGMYSRWPRSLSRAPGESVTMTVERDGALVSGEIVYRDRPWGVGGLRWGGLLVGLAFLWSGGWVFLTAPSPHALRLAVMGLAMGLVIPGPSLGSWNGLRDHLQVAGIVLWNLMMFRFFLFFPERKARGTGPLATALTFGGWGLLLVCLVLELLFHPRFYHAFAPLYGLLMLGYGILALGVFLVTLSRTPKANLAATGMGWVAGGVGSMMGSLLVALLLVLVPGFPSGGAGPLVLLGLLALPAGLAMGVRKGAVAREPSGSPSLPSLE